MINHFFTTLYNRPAATVSGIYVGLTEPLRVPSVVAFALGALRGPSRDAAEAFAIQALKVVEGSSYRQEILAQDPRLTYALGDVGMDMPDSSSFLTSLAFTSGDLQILITSTYPDLRETLMTSMVLQDRAAAVVVGIVRLITKENM
jgi:hypothetical protein